MGTTKDLKKIGDPIKFFPTPYSGVEWGFVLVINTRIERGFFADYLLQGYFIVLEPYGVINEPSILQSEITDY